MKFPDKLFHFGKSQYVGDFIPNGVISFGLASGFLNNQLTKGQQDEEMKRTATPPMEGTTVLVEDKLETATPLSNVFSSMIKLGIRSPYFMKCFSLGFSNEMYDEVDGDVCVEIRDVPSFRDRFVRALSEQLPDWGAVARSAEYWDLSEIPVERNQLDLMFLKDKTTYSHQKEFRIVLTPPNGFEVTDQGTRKEIVLGPLHDICVLHCR